MGDNNPHSDRKPQANLRTPPPVCPNREILAIFARRYVWWKTPEETILNPERVVAQVMTLGDYEDVQLLVRSVGEAYLRHVITHPQPGMFDDRAWAYWHYRLDLCPPLEVPPLPLRKVA